MSSVATWGILPLAKLDCHLNQFFFVSSNFFGLGRAKKVSIYVQTTVFPVRPRRKNISNFWKFTLLGLHYTSFRPTDPPAQDVRTQNLNTSVSALTSNGSIGTSNMRSKTMQAALFTVDERSELRTVSLS